VEVRYATVPTGGLKGADIVGDATGTAA